MNQQISEMPKSPTPHKWGSFACKGPTQIGVFFSCKKEQLVDSLNAKEPHTNEALLRAKQRPNTNRAHFHAGEDSKKQLVNFLNAKEPHTIGAFLHAKGLTHRGFIFMQERIQSNNQQISLNAKEPHANGALCVCMYVCVCVCKCECVCVCVCVCVCMCCVCVCVCVCASPTKMGLFCMQGPHTNRALFHARENSKKPSVDSLHAKEPYTNQALVHARAPLCKNHRIWLFLSELGSFSQNPPECTRALHKEGVLSCSNPTQIELFLSEQGSFCQEPLKCTRALHKEGVLSCSNPTQIELFFRIGLFLLGTP